MRNSDPEKLDETGAEEYQNRLIDEIYAAGSGSVRWNDVLASLCDLLRGDIALFACHDLTEHSGRIKHAHNVPSSFLQAYAERYGQENPWIKEPLYIKQGGRVYPGDAILRRDKLKETPFYREFLSPLDIGHTLHAGVARSNNRQLFLVVGRDEAKGPFSAIEIDFCQAMVGHIRRAWRSQRNAAQHLFVEQGTLEALHLLSVGVAMVDARGKILVMNESAKLIVESNDGLYFSELGVIATHNSKNARLQEVISKCVSNKPDKEPRGMSVLAIARPSGRRPYSVMICPFEGRRDLLDENNTAALMFIIDPEQAPHEISDQVLQKAYNLTPAEARVAAMVAQGQRLFEVAEGLEISVNTARTHLKRIFDKTGVERQAELVHLLHDSLWLVRSDHNPSNTL